MAQIALFWLYIAIGVRVGVPACLWRLCCIEDEPHVEIVLQ